MKDCRIVKLVFLRDSFKIIIETRQRQKNKNILRTFIHPLVLRVDDVVEFLQSADRAVLLRVLLVSSFALEESSVQLDAHREDGVGGSAGLADHVEDHAASQLVQQLNGVTVLH
jgi:hypothetical protein